jgi:hypothetical protein
VQSDIFSKVKCANLTALKYIHKCNGYGKDTIKTRGCKYLLKEFQFDGICKRNGIPNNRTIFMLRTNWGQI